jgi:hypothetical protein
MTALLVPIQLDALVVRDGSETWAQTEMTTPKPRRGQHRRQELLPDPFTSLDPPRPAGVYLHWALPDALTRFRHQSGARDVWPVPDRWLVLRLTGDTTAGPRSVHAWLLPDVNAQTPAVIDPLAGAAIPDPGPAPANPLTYLGHGDPAWAAYFDNCVDRLALFDNLAGVSAGPIAYLACGWYQRDPAHDDPLAVGSESEFEARLGELVWSCQRTTGDPFPATSVFHGSAVAIGWPDASWPGDGGTLGSEQDLRPDPATIGAAVGETAAEAVAAPTTQDPDNPALTRMVEGLIDASLAELAAADGPARLDTALHLSRFGSRPSAHADEVIWEPTSSTGDVPPADGGGAGTGGAAAALAASSGATGAGAGDSEDDGVPGNFRTVKRTQPRVWHALNPEIVLSGAGRSFKHGGDGRFTADGTLACRVEGQEVSAFGVQGGDAGAGAAVLAADPLAGLAPYGVPTAAAGLLVELTSLDPGSAPDLGTATATQPSPVAAQRARSWGLRDPDTEPGDALAGASIVGTLPSPIAVTAPTRPWVPLRLEWKADYLPSARGAHDWQLADVDFELPDELVVPAVDPAHALIGRVMLSSAPAQALAAAATGVAEAATAGGIADPDSAALLADAAAAAGGTQALSDALGDSDLLSGAFADIMEQMRGDPTGAIITDPASGPADPSDPGGAPPAGFIALRAGFMSFTALRLVDAYGQLLDLLPGLDLQSAPSTAVDGHPELVALRPRFTADARVLLRYSAANGDKVDASPGISPVTGYVVPSPLDGTLEFFDDEGSRLGRLRPDDVTGTAWEEDPGLPPSLGASPSRFIPNAALGAFADALLAADTTAAAAGGSTSQTALDALLRAIDTTRWTIDVAGQAGDEHLALLLGRPVAVMRATVLLDVQDPHDPPENRTISVPLKLGTLAHLQDGLLAYAVGDQISEVRVVDPLVADVGAITSPFVNAEPAFDVNPGVPVPLLLLMVPQSDIHATTGLLPQKVVGMLRDWTAPALAKISPALRYGPVLHDAKVVRLPVPADVRGTWTWHHLTDPMTWASDEVVAATSDAVIGQDPAIATEGWLSVALIPDNAYVETAVGVQVTHVRSRGSTGRQIIAVGGTNPDGTHFLIPTADAARLQESGRFVFFVQRDASQPPKYATVVTRRGSKFLWTPHDATTGNNLLSLPEAPADW